MTDSLENTQHSKSSVTRWRKSIFGNQKPKPNHQQPKLLLNGETIEDWRPVKSASTQNFFTPNKNKQELKTELLIQSNRPETRTISRPSYLPENAFNRVIITDSNPTKCIRPVSMGKRSVIYNTNQIISKPATVYTTHVVSPQKQVLVSPIIISPQQGINEINNNVGKGSTLKRKCVIVEGKPHENVIYRQVPVEQPQPVQIIKQIHPQVNKIIIQDDPKTISQLNKLNSLNQFLTQQYTLINNQLVDIRNRTTPKLIVEQTTFLQKSMNTIDEIFMRQTNQALYKLEEISRCKSNKHFQRSPSKKLRTVSPDFKNRKPNNLIGDGIYSPVNSVEQLQNSSYIDKLKHLRFSDA